MQLRISTWVLLLLCIAADARAQPSPKAAAEATFQRGRELFAAGQHEEACAQYQASLALDPALGTLLHLADCCERIGKTASAWAAFREAASVAQVSGQAQREEIANTRAAALEPHLCRVALVVPEEHRVEGLVVELAGVAVPPASWGVALPVDPGAQLVARHRPWTGSIDVAGDEPVRVEVPKLAALPSPVMHALEPQGSERRAAPVAAPTAVEGSSGEPQRVAGIVIGGVGLAGPAWAGREARRRRRRCARATAPW